MDKPDVDFIEGLSPAVSIDQKSTNRNPRSTVGTITEVYDYLRLLYARAGRPHCPVCGESGHAPDPQQIVDRSSELPERAPGSRCWRRWSAGARASTSTCSASSDQGLLARPGRRRGHLADRAAHAEKQKKHTIEVVVDRLAVKGR
jgi:excinuclease ABC subunit A